jgi:transmembrane sensor
MVPYKRDNIPTDMNSERIWQLLSRKIDGEATMDELRELEQLLIENPDAYKIDTVSAYLQKTGNKNTGGEEETAAWENHVLQARLAFPEDFISTNDPVKVGSPVTKSVFSRWALAAVVSGIILAAGGTWVIYNKPGGYKISERIHKMSGGGSPVAHIIAKTKQILPDGTVVWLNGNSSISYSNDFGKNIREVKLNGEAFFDVAHNVKIPFIVHAKTINITVKGTAFNVKAYPEEANVETALVRGVIELSTRSDPKRKIILKPYEKIIIPAPDTGNITRDDRNLYHIEKLIAEPSSNLIPEVSWLQDKLVFNSEPLSEVSEKMQRWYNVRIEIKNEELNGLKFTGVFERESLSQALSALQFTYPFEFEMHENNVYIFKK